MPRRPHLVTLIVLLLAMFSSPATAQTDGGETVDDVPFERSAGEERIHSWTLTPAGDPGNGATRPNMSYTAVPGTVIEDAVTVFNLGNESLTFELYSTDAFTGAEGQLALLSADDEPVGVGTWVELVQGLVTLAPGQQATIPVTIEVPLDATPGDHVGAVLASNEAITTDANGAVVLLDRRTGTRLYVRVDGALQGEVAVEDLSVDFSGGVNPVSGDAEVSYVLANRGNIRLTGEAVLKVSGPFGISETVLDPVVFEDFLPGDVIEITETVDGVPAAFVINATVEVTTDVSEAVQVTADDRSARTLALPLTLILLGFLLLFGWLGYRAFRRHEQSPAVVGGFVERERERETVG
ncbi:MAG: DUF916 domain-containing protein [Actinomycetota bacterium]